ncbi:MAG: pilin [bacterium]|nr:pilin [bacterium]
MTVRKLAKTLAFFLLVFLFAATSIVAAQREFDSTKGEVDKAGPEGVATLKGLEVIFENVISVALALAGIVLFVMFLIGGFRFITSGGDPKAVEAAKGTLTHAVLGLIVVILAFLILQLIANITGVTGIMNFQVFQVPKP